MVKASQLAVDRQFPAHTICYQATPSRAITHACMLLMLIMRSKFLRSSSVQRCAGSTRWALALVRRLLRMRILCIIPFIDGCGWIAGLQSGSIFSLRSSINKSNSALMGKWIHHGGGSVQDFGHEAYRYQHRALIVASGVPQGRILAGICICYRDAPSPPAVSI